MAACYTNNASLFLDLGSRSLPDELSFSDDTMTYLCLHVDEILHAVQRVCVSVSVFVLLLVCVCVCVCVCVSV